MQARFASTRLPGKALAKIENLPSLAHVLIRALRIPGVTRFVLATTTDKLDDELVEIALGLGYQVFRGDKNDLVSRLHLAAEMVSADFIVRITGDCPVLDPILAGKVLAKALGEKADLTLNYSPPTFPDGLDVAVFSMKGLERLSAQNLSAFDREHVTTAIERGSTKLLTSRVTSRTNLAHNRWTLDNIEDLEFFNALSSYCSSPLVQMTTQEILQIVQDNPELAEINAKYSRNYGHQL